MRLFWEEPKKSLSQSKAHASGENPACILNKICCSTEGFPAWEEAQSQGCFVEHQKIELRNHDGKIEPKGSTGLDLRGFGALLGIDTEEAIMLTCIVIEAPHKNKEAVQIKG